VGTLRGLRALHEELRVVHRDVKPANLLLDHSGAVKVADFGVAFTLPEAADVRTGAMGQAGSIAYMAPECIRGEPNGSPGDIWALGVTLLELAGGEHPYAARSTGGGSAARFWSVATSLGALEGPPEREAKVDAIVSAHMDAHVRGLSRRAGFEAFVRRCLAGDPKDRPSAAELLRDPWLTGPR
jgi:serine/threonine protein kinase